MEFVPFDFGNGPFFKLPADLFGYALLAFYSLLALLSLVRAWPTFRQFNAGRWLALLALMGLGAALAQTIVFRFPANILPPPGVPAETQRPGLSLFAFLPALLAGGWLGVGPAVLVGLAIGTTRAAFETFSVITPLEYALVAGAAAWCLRQDYRGWPARLLRRSLVTGLALGGLFWPGLYLSYLAYSSTPGLIGWDYVASLVSAAAPVFFGQVALAGLFAEFARAALPTWWPQLRGSAPPPYLSSLNRKLLFTLIPLFSLGIVLLFWANLTIAIRVSTDLAIDQMERAAINAAQDIPYFIQTGRSLLGGAATQENLLSGGALGQTQRLAENMRTPFFRQMALYDADLTLLAIYPEEQQVLNTLTEEEQAIAQRTLASVAQDLVLYPTTPGDSTQVVFMAPVKDAASAQAVAVLIGVAELDASPFMQSIAGTLDGLAGGQGDGFIVDSQGYIIYPNPEQSPLPTFSLETLATPVETGLPEATAYEDKDFAGRRRLVLYYPAPGHDWSVVVTVPNSWVLTVATQISQPIVLILLLIGLIGLLLVSLIATQVTRPAEALALAAQRISEGRLDLPVVIEGEDEIGRAGLAFERMRQKLRARLDELGLLLRVSQSVSSNLNLDDALPPILEGALTNTGAAGARVVLMPKDEALALNAYQTHTSGEAAALMAPLDRGVVELARTEGRVVIENLARARAVLDVAPVAGKLRALVALPLRQETTYYGVLWLGYTQPHPFTEAEVNLLTTLAGQAAVAVANARLFDAAEQGRQRLAAILASTPDAVIVTDREARILLLNPAAEKVLSLAQGGVGQPAVNVLPNPELAKLLTEGRAPANTIEVELAGKTLSASASTIISADGSVVGRVGVLRDVTRFKEVDAMKSEFVATVSHDLRAPLTFMRGYATMLPMVGGLNDKQREFAEKIIIGIEQMTNLIDDLLDLGRIEAGIGLAREACRMDHIIAGVVETVKPQALNKGLNLLVDVAPDLPGLSGDATLLRQAIANLVENAIKYTPSGGQVGVSVTTDPNRFTLAVSDTGVGIAPADQTRLFEKFFRVKQRGSTQVKGSGLGLAIVKTIIERHGGRVWVESKLGKGSIFYVEIPRNGVGG